MTPTSVALAAALLATSPTIADARPPQPAGAVSATYDAANRRFCIRADRLETAEITGLRLFRRQCLSEQGWHERGIHFVLPRALARSGGS